MNSGKEPGFENFKVVIEASLVAVRLKLGGKFEDFFAVKHIFRKPISAHLALDEIGSQAIGNTELSIQNSAGRLGIVSTDKGQVGRNTELSNVMNGKIPFLHGLIQRHQRDLHPHISRPLLQISFVNQPVLAQILVIPAGIFFVRDQMPVCMNTVKGVIAVIKTHLSDSSGSNTVAGAKSRERGDRCRIWQSPRYAC